MDVANSFCACCGNPARLYCACSTPHTLLCDSCVVTHSLDKPSLNHSPKHLNSTQAPNYHDRLRVRVKNFPGVKNETRRNIQDIDKAIHQFAKYVEKVIWELTCYAEKEIKRLNDIKEKLRDEAESALEEVERTLKENSPELTSLYGPLLRELTESGGAVQLFAFSLKSHPITPSALVTVSTYLVSGQDINLQPHTLFPSVYKNAITVYDVESQQITRHSLSVNFDKGGSFVQLDCMNLLCVGANPASAAVYELNLTTFQQTALPEMTTPRNAPGIAKVASHIYVFGGVGSAGYLTTCEKMDITDKQWVSTANNMLYPRISFTPCHHRALLYLVCSRNEANRTIETFHPETEVFALLPIQLPSEIQIGWASVAFVVNGELCLLTDNQQMARWKVDSEHEFRVENTGTTCFSTQQPLVMGSVVLIAYQGGVRQFSLETYSFTKYVK